MDVVCGARQPIEANREQGGVCDSKFMISYFSLLVILMCYGIWFHIATKHSVYQSKINCP